MPGVNPTPGRDYRDDRLEDWPQPVPREREEPPVEPYHGKAWAGHIPGIPMQSVPRSARDIDVDAERQRIAELLRRMPFSGLVSDPLPDPEKIDELYLAWLYEWLLSYSRVVQEQSDEFTRQAHQTRRLLDQRDSIRAFFGVASEDDMR
jgi:hypothetical protein